jgi:S1-C subfamily serine protease
LKVLFINSREENKPMTGKVLDQCPKCSSKITNEIECETCGIVFEKYFQAEARKKAEAEQVTIEATGSGNRRVVIMVSLVIISTFITAIYFGGRSHFLSGLNRVNPPVTDQTIQNVKEKSSQSLPVKVAEISDNKWSNEEPIQRALSGTVLVRTPWGSLGSGFFIGEHAVITNKHVVTFDDNSFEAFKNGVERNRKIIDLEIEKINEWKGKILQMTAGPSRSQLELFIQGKEDEVNKALLIQRKNEEKVEKLTDQKYSQDLKIVTADNKEYSVDSIIPSTTHDLALLKVDSISGQVLKRDTKEQRLEQGQVVYTIGSPFGLSNTVTSGVFSAYRKKVNTDETYLQIDAAINPGNSGGPLIDKQGNVLGVNTMVLTHAEGIGFAIPIDVVFEDFSDSL